MLSTAFGRRLTSLRMTTRKYWQGCGKYQSGLRNHVALSQVLAPAFRQGYEGDGTLQQLGAVGPAIIKMIDVVHGDRGWVAMKDFDGRSGGDFAFFNY